LLKAIEDKEDSSARLATVPIFYFTYYLSLGSFDRAGAYLGI
jgi:hypothetical protein